MAFLAGHGQHQRLGLSNAKDANSKHVVSVKLTDASLEAFNEFIKNSKKSTSPSSSTKKPTIQFSQNSGTIRIPIGEDGKQATFSFSLSSIEDQNGPQGSFECLESKRPGSLESQGLIQDKIHVQASDDAYARFGERMSDVKKDNEKRSTQILENRAPGCGLFSNTNVANKLMRKHHQMASNKLAGGPKPVNSISRFSHSHGPPGAGLMLSGSHPMLDRNAAKHKRAHNNQEIMKRPLRERIVHLLAVRPYKRPELNDRLSRDGLREKERKEIFSVLRQVSMMKDNTYHLLRHIWNDVSEDWEYYTEEERQAFRRRKPQNLTPPNSDGSLSSGHSSSSSHPASPTTLKRSNAMFGPPASACPTGSGDPSSSSSAAGSGGSLGEPQAKKRRTSNYKRASPASDASMRQANTNAWLLSQPQPGCAAAGSDDDDYRASFTAITNGEQRKRYKLEFNREYERYLECHAELAKVSNRFFSLENQLKQHHETSPGHKRLKDQILEEYEANKRNQKYMGQRAQFNYLHAKLAHIKKLVYDYDNARS